MVWNLASASPSASQAPKPGDRVAEIVALDFYAATPDGSPVADLKAEEVRVRIDGRPRALKWLEWVPVADAPSESTTVTVTPVPPPFASNAPSDAGQSFVLVIENESFRPGRERRLREAVDRFLAALSPRDRAALMTTPYGDSKST